MSVWLLTGTSEGDRERDVELAACEVVGDCVLDVVDICDPVVAAYVRDVEEVEDVEGYHDTAEVTPEVVGAYAVGWCSD